MSSSGIDYSKWDHFGDSSNDEEEREQAAARPRVTKLDTPSQISTTRDGTIHVSQQQQQQKDTNSQMKESSMTNKNKTTKDAASVVQEWTERGGTIQLNNHTTTSSSSTLYWSQDGETVVLRMTVPSTTKSSSVSVSLDGAVSLDNRHCATLTAAKPTLHVTLDDSTTTLLQGELPYPVYLEDDNVMDWTLETTTIHDENNKYLVVTLYKATPMPGMTISWTRPMMQFDEIPIQQQQQQGSFQQAWNQAHEQFKLKMQQKKNASMDGTTLVHDE